MRNELGFRAGFAALLGFVSTILAMPAQASDCYAPTWRTVTDTAIGASFEMTADPTTDYYIAYTTGEPAVSTDETARSGNEIAGRCSSFSVAALGLGGQIGDAKGFLDHRVAEVTKGLRDGKLLMNRSLTVGGFPAREYQYSFVIDYFFTPARHRVLDVVRGDKLVTFSWSWGDAGSPPEDSNREYNSIRLLTAAPSEHMRSFALLQETLKKYWLYPASNDNRPGYLSDALRAKFGPTREADRKILDAYGYPREISFLRYDDGAKVMRIKHDSATVDYTVRDNGKEITAITWRKVDPNAAASSSAPVALAAGIDLAPIKAARARFVAALITTPALNTRFHVFAGNDWCSVAYSLLPSGQTPDQLAVKDAFKIDWRWATSIDFIAGEPDADAWWKNYIKVESARGGYWPLHPGVDQVGPMLAAGNEMRRLCKDVPPVGG